MRAPPAIEVASTPRPHRFSQAPRNT